MISDLLASSFTVSIGTAPSSFNDSPLERVLLVYTKVGEDTLIKYFCRFLDIPMPIEPSPIHPTCGCDIVRIVYGTLRLVISVIKALKKNE